MAVATLDGRAYYRITALMKEMGIPFYNVLPGEKLRAGTRLVFSTEKERPSIKHDKVICLEEFQDVYAMKERILSHLYGDGEDSLLIGIDPGRRTGLAVCYRQRMVSGEVLNSLDEAIKRVARLIHSTHAKKKVVRIGNGEPDLAEEMARSLSRLLRGSAIIELVDERGTSSLSIMKQHKRVMRDQRSAMMIALRQGKRYVK